MPDHERWLAIERDGVTLAAYEYSRIGPAVILLHGLLGHAREWDDTTAWLQRGHRVIALDQRGHGRSQRRPPSMAPEELAADVLAWVDQLRIEPVIVVGQSLGGLVAMLVAAGSPSIVRGVVVAEASPSLDPGAPARVGRWLDRWPRTFASREAALEFFGGNTLTGRAWTDGLVESEGGLAPAFDREVVLGALLEPAGREYWEEWTTITCPVLVVRGESGLVEAEVERMARTRPGTTVATVAGARHDVHLEQPLAWRRALEDHIDGLA